MRSGGSKSGYVLVLPLGSRSYKGAPMAQTQTTREPSFLRGTLWAFALTALFAGAFGGIYEINHSPSEVVASR